MSGGPQPVMSLDEFRRAAHSMSSARQDARRDYERYSEQEAEAEREYRKTLAVAFASASGVAKQREYEANEKASEARHKRDLAKAMSKSAVLRIEALEADRATLRTVAEWSQRIGGVTA